MTDPHPTTEVATTPVSRADLETRLETHRPELTAYCYRMLGSPFEAEDAVQDAFLRAWRAIDRFEGRSSLRSWLYRIATNVCLDMLTGPQRRARPIDLTPAGRWDGPLGERPEDTWLLPFPDARLAPAGADPAAVALTREGTRLALVAALQHLPPRQRAVLILREVLDWRAAEVAELLDSSVASVNSALQRARATLAAKSVAPTDTVDAPLDERAAALLVRYVAAFEAYNLDALTALLHEDATWSMPPFSLWLQTHEDIRGFCLGPGIACRGSRLIPTTANGAPAFGQYKPDPDGGYTPWALQLVDLSRDGVAGVTFFLDTARLFPLFGLPPRLEA